MSRKTLIFGFLLVLIGVGGYLVSHGSSPTALVPVVFGLLLTLAGFVVGRSHKAGKHELQIAALICFLGASNGLIMGARSAVTWLNGSPDMALRVFSQMSLGVVCILFLLSWFRSARLPGGASKD